MKKVFVYTRISTEAQTDGGGIERQIAECRKFCESQGWNIVREFIEQKSGTVSAFDRPVLSELVSLCGDAFDVNTIVVERADRLARDLIVSELFFQECKKLGLEVYAADCGQELVNAEGDASRKMIRQILGAVSEWNKNEIAKKLLAGRKRTAEKTGWPCGGKPAYGRGKGEAIWVRRILHGHRRGWKISQICQFVNYWAAWRHGRPKFFVRSTVYDIIKTWNHRAEFAGEITYDSLLDDSE